MLSKRDTCVDGWGHTYNCDSTWRGYGRWIFLAIIIVAAIFFFIAFSCFSSRRRKASGQRPFIGTAWAAQPPPFIHSSGPPPPYTPDAAPGTQLSPPAGPLPPQQQQGYGQGGSYYAPHQTDVEAQNAARGYFGGTGVSNGGYNMELLQQPPSSYQPVRDGTVPLNGDHYGGSGGGGSPVYGPPPGAPPGYQPSKGGFA